MRAEPAARTVGAAAVAAMLLFGTAGCVVGPPPVPPSPWADALQACGMPPDALAAPWPAPGPDFCQRADALGLQLDCLARVLPASAAALSHFSVTGLLEFQACLQPLAAGLRSGRAGRPDDMDLALRHCVQQLDVSPAGPRVPPPWWQVPRPAVPARGGQEGQADAVALPPAPQVPPPPAALRLRPSGGLSWAACADSAAMKPAAATGQPPARVPGRDAAASDRAAKANPRFP